MLKVTTTELFESSASFSQLFLGVALLKYVSKKIQVVLSSESTIIFALKKRFQHQYKLQRKVRKVSSGFKPL